jgi:hypothetical protein
MIVMKAYSEDLHTRIVAAVEGGMPKTQAARTFGVSLSSVKRYCRLTAQEKPLAPRKGGGRPTKANAAVGLGRSLTPSSFALASVDLTAEENYGAAGLERDRPNGPIGMPILLM